MIGLQGGRLHQSVQSLQRCLAQRTAYKVVVVSAEGPISTFKYMFALSLQLQPISAEWLRSCVAAGRCIYSPLHCIQRLSGGVCRLLELDDFTLPLGVSSSTGQHTLAVQAMCNAVATPGKVVKKLQVAASLQQLQTKWMLGQTVALCGDAGGLSLCLLPSIAECCC